MSELRKDPIVGRWVIISTERGKRPHDFKFEKVQTHKQFCPFDAGNESYAPNEIYSVKNENPQRKGAWILRVVPNKYPALKVEGSLGKHALGMYDIMNGIGAHEVIIETPIHGENISDMDLMCVFHIVNAYKARIIDLKRDIRMKYIMVFKNFGYAAGASLEHSHSQLIALPIVPISILEKIEGSKQYFNYRGRCIVCDMVDQEIQEAVRLVDENENFIVVEPFASRFPFETWIIPKNHEAHYEHEKDYVLKNFASILKETVARLSTALDAPPYNFVLINGSFDNNHDSYFHWHLEIIPRLIRIAGFEWGSGFYINTTSPEDAADFLRNVQI